MMNEIDTVILMFASATFGYGIRAAIAWIRRLPEDIEEVAEAFGAVARSTPTTGPEPAT